VRQRAFGATGKGQAGQQPYQIRRQAPKRNQTLDFEQEMQNAKT
jgi:hypothetical protein